MKKLLFFALIFSPLFALAMEPVTDPNILAQLNQKSNDTTQNALDQLTPEQRQQLVYEIMLQKIRQNDRPQQVIVQAPQPSEYDIIRAKLDNQNNQPTHTDCTPWQGGFNCHSY